MDLKCARNPVVFFVNGLGDCILNLPALRAITALFEGKSVLICEEGEHSYLFEELPVRKLVLLKNTGRPAGSHMSTRTICRELQDCDLFISLVPWMSNSLKAVLASLGQCTTIGFFPEYSVHVPLDFTKHSADLAFDVVRTISADCAIEGHLRRPRFSPLAVLLVEQIKKLLPIGARFLAVHPDSALEKMWNSNRLRTAIESFLELRKEFYAFVVGYKRVRLDTGRCADRVIPCYQKGFTFSSCLVAHADLFLGIDSCYLHVADFAEVPGVGLFGPTDAAEFGFRVGPHITIQARRQMQEIQIDSVVAALGSIADNPRQSSVWRI